MLLIKPESGNFGGRIQQEGLPDRTEKLSHQDKLEAQIAEAAYAGSKRSGHRSDDDSLANALDIEYPVGGEVHEDVHDHVHHRDQSHKALVHLVSGCHLLAYRSQHDPAHTIDERG